MPSWSDPGDRPALIEQWLGDGYKVKTQKVEASDWRNLAWRTEFLSRKVRLNRYHVYDEAADDEKRLIVFASPHSD